MDNAALKEIAMNDTVHDATPPRTKTMLLYGCRSHARMEQTMLKILVRFHEDLSQGEDACPQLLERITDAAQKTRDAIDALAELIKELEENP